MKKSVFVIAILSAFAVSLRAQVITWSVKPGKYSKIEPCWQDLYFVYNSNSMGVITGDGQIVVNPDADRITGFYNDLALVLKSEGGKERIMGILKTDGSYLKVNGTYYTIPYQEFFSEGLLTVVTDKDQAGFMNVNGVIVKSFDTSFISPFSEGYAVVGENENFTIVDKLFNAINIQLGTVAPIYGGSNVYNGQAIIWDANGKFYNYDVNRGVCRKVSEPKSLDYDYMYCFSCISKRPQNVPYEKLKRCPETFMITEQDYKFGYIYNNRIILPCQFEQAERFHGKYAIVKNNGQYALLSAHETNDNFSVKLDSEIKYRKSAGKNLKHQFGISVPLLWNNESLGVRVKDENGNAVSIVNKGDSYEFISDGDSGTKKYTVEIESDGLNLWKGEMAYHYTILPESRPEMPKHEHTATNFSKLSVTLKTSNTQADKNNLCCVLATITNPNSAAITTKVIWSGSSLLEGSNKTVTVPANGKTTVKIYLKVTKAVTGQTVTVSTNAGGSATLNGLQLIPF